MLHHHEGIALREDVSIKVSEISEIGNSLLTFDEGNYKVQVDGTNSLLFLPRNLSDLSRLIEKRLHQRRPVISDGLGSINK